VGNERSRQARPEVAVLGAPIRLVLDTHVWLDWLVFEDPGIVAIRDAVVTQRAEVYVDAACEEELARVLARGVGKRTLDAEIQTACMNECRRLAKRIEAPASDAARAALPRCGDPDDQKFLEAALAAGADCLVTKDRKLLALARKSGVPFRIVTPGEFGRT
jgi:putative PIN family toxin of toxin-antitoxin system